MSEPKKPKEPKEPKEPREPGGSKVLTDADKLRLQAGFDGELTPQEWHRLREDFRDSPEAEAYLAELATLRETLASAPDAPVPAGLAESIKAQIPRPSAGRERDVKERGNVIPVRFGGRGQGHSPRPARQLAGGLALAASLVLAVGLGVQFLGVSELGMDSQMRSRMTGTLLEPAAMEAQRHWQWEGMDARASLMRSASGLTLELELDAESATDLVLQVSGDQWRWRQEATSVPISTGRGISTGRDAAGEQLRLAVNGKKRYRLVLEPATRDGDSAQGPLPAPRIGVAVQRDGQLVHQGAIVPGE